MGDSEICLFCYKICGAEIFYGEVDNEPRNSSSRLTRFVTFLERFTNQPGKYQELSDNSVDGLKFLGCCTPCGVIVDAFCDEYHQMKCLEMKLEWKLERLVGIMELAGRMPSRWLKLQQIFQHQHTSTSSVSTGAMDGVLKCLRGYRQNITKQCNKRLSSSKPRVTIKRPEIVDKFVARILKPVHILSATEWDTMSHPSETEMDTVNKIKSERDTSVDEDTTTGTVHAEGTETKPVIVPVKLLNFDEGESSQPDMACFSDVDTFSDFDDNTDQSDQYTYNEKLESLSDDTNPAMQTSSVDQLVIKTEPDEINQTTKSLVKLESQAFPCQQCSKSFLTKLLLAAHLRCVHVQPKFQCPTCKKMFKTTKNLNQHCKRMKHKTPKASKIFQCAICSESCGSKWLLGRHLVRVHSIHSCKECRQEFKTHRLLKKHLIETHKHPAPTITLHECDKCGRKFQHKYKLRGHKLSIHKLGTPTACGNLQGSPGHEKSSNIKPSSEAICKFCSDKFPSRRHLAMHMRLEHVNKGSVGNCKLIQCPKCESKFLNKYLLNQHIRRVHTTAKHQCLKCSRRFKRKSGLLVHQVIHEEKKIQCTECGAMFFSKNALIFHTKSYHIPNSQYSTFFANHPNNIGKPGGEKKRKFECPECGKNLQNARNLREHMLSHRQGERLECNHCDRTFKHSISLQRHCRSQHGIYTKKTLQKPTNSNNEYVRKEGKYECRECGKMWTELSKLKRHLVIHEKGEPMICQHCGNKYPHMVALERHVRRMHKDVPNEISKTNNGD